MFLYSRTLKLLVAGFYSTVVLAAGFFHTHHDCGCENCGCEKARVACCGHDRDAFDTGSDVKTAKNHGYCTCHGSCETAMVDAEKPTSATEIRSQHTSNTGHPQGSTASDGYGCPICSFLAQKPIPSVAIVVPTWVPLSGERVETVQKFYPQSISFSWFSRGPPLCA